MNCFTHPTTAAIGLCKSCYKGVCKDCVAEVGDTLACKNKCESNVQLLNQIIANNAVVIKRANKLLKGQAIFSISCGIAFTALWLFMPTKPGSNPFSFFFMAMGIIFLAAGVLRLKKKSVYPEIEAVPSETNKIIQ